MEGGEVAGRGYGGEGGGRKGKDVKWEGGGAVRSWRGREGTKRGEEAQKVEGGGAGQGKERRNTRT